jgi:transposase
MDWGTDELLARFRMEKDARLAERYHALYVVSKGYTIKETAELFGRDESTIHSWIKLWKEKRSVEDEPRSGRPPEIGEKLEKKIIRMVDENNPRKHGENVASWDCRELCGWLAKRQVVVSEETVRSLLIRNDFRYVKPGYDFLKADPVEQNGFINRFRRILRGKPSDTRVAFLDEMSTKLHPKQGYIWTRQKKPVVPTHCSHQRVYTVGAVLPETGKLVTRTTNRFKQFDFVKFLEQLVRETRQRIILFVDGFRVHKTRLVQDFLREHPRLQIEKLPAYSPKLNPIEHLWGYTRQKRTFNTEFQNKRSAQKTLDHWFHQLPKKIVRSVCSLHCIPGIT